MKNLMKIDPFRALTGWDPLENLRRMQAEMDRVFARVLGGETMTTGHFGHWMPSVESYVKDGKLVCRFEIPGIEPEELDVSVTDREIIIKGERKASKDMNEENYLYREISYGTFERHFALPEGAKTDDVKATFSNGILEVSLPAPVSARSRKIEVATARAKEEAPAVKKAA